MRNVIHSISAPPLKSAEGCLLQKRKMVLVCKKCPWVTQSHAPLGSQSSPSLSAAVHRYWHFQVKNNAGTYPIPGSQLSTSRYASLVLDLPSIKADDKQPRTLKTGSFYCSPANKRPWQNTKMFYLCGPNSGCSRGLPSWRPGTWSS